MFVYEVDTYLAHLLPSVVEVLAAGRRSGAAADLDVGVLGPYLFDKFSQALRIERSPLFVADTYLMEVERLRVTHLGTQCAPLGA